MKIRVLLSVIAAAAMTLTACQSSQPAQQTTPPPQPVAQEDPPPAEEPPAEDPEDVHIVDNHITIDRHLHFATDSDELLEDSNELLDHIALLISHHGDQIGGLHVIGHTDASGGHAHNQDLSERRAAAVVSALQARGVTLTLDSRGVGETEPVCQEDTEECHTQNRRVEFVIVPPTAGGEG